MPWKELLIMDQRKEFVLKAFDPNVNFSRLCSEFCISTKTGYKWKQRFQIDGLDSVKYLSHFLNLTFKLSRDHIHLFQ